MTSDLVLCRAQGVVARALKYYPAGVRALLPLDPADPDDVRHWIRRTIQAGKPGRFSGLPGAVVRRLRWTALDAARKARRRLPRSRDDRLLMAPDPDPLDRVADKPPWQAQWGSAVDNLAADAAAAACALVDAGGPGCRRRKACAMLACLARSIAAVRADVGPDVAGAYVKHLASDPAFRRMPLAPDRRRCFINAMVALNGTPRTVSTSPRANLRRDLEAAGQPWPQTRTWKEFSEAFDRHRVLRLASSTPSPR